jgi:hypothetical protein
MSASDAPRANTGISCENGGDRVERRGGTIAGRQPRAEDDGEATGDRVTNSGRVGDGPRLNVLSSASKHRGKQHPAPSRHRGHAQTRAPGEQTNRALTGA